MKFTRGEVRILEVALINYKQLWLDSDKLPEEVPYIDANIMNFHTILQKIKSENTQ